MIVLCGILKFFFVGRGTDQGQRTAWLHGEARVVTRGYLSDDGVLRVSLRQTLGWHALCVVALAAPLGWHALCAAQGQASVALAAMASECTAEALAKALPVRVASRPQGAAPFAGSRATTRTHVRWRPVA